MKYPNRRTFVAAAASGAFLSACDDRAPIVRDKTADLSIDGRVVKQGDGDYEDWRTGVVWQGRKPGRSPAMIVRPKTARAVQDAVRYAHAAGLKIAVKSAGHHVWANFLRDGGMLIDLWDLRSVNMIEGTDTAWVEPSAWSQEIMLRLGESGRSFPAAHCASVGMGGFLLGGGIGHNLEHWGGLSAYSIIGADVVMADGQLSYIDDDNDPDLTWALRGAGNGFPAIVTRFKLQTFEAPKALKVGTYFFPLERAIDAIIWAQDLARSGKLPNTEPLVILAHSPMAPVGATGADAKVCLVLFNVFGKSEEAANAVLTTIASQPMAKSAAMAIPSKQWDVQESFYTTLDFRNPLNFGHFGVDNIWTNRAGEAITALAVEFAKAPTPATHVVMSPIGKTSQHSNAVARMHGDLYMGLYSVGSTPQEGEQAIGWLRRTSAALQPYASGRYINEIDAENDPAAVSQSFAREDWDKLQRVRAAYDPQQRFHGFFGLTVA